MADTKISDLVELTGANLADDDEFLVVDTSGAQSKRITRAELAASLSSNDGISLGDSVKATFGDSSDLEIYHDGSNSYIDDTATGWLNLRGDSRVKIGSVVSGETMAEFIANGAVNLYYDNALKIATTSTGIDVTGTLSTDALTVNGASITAGGQSTLAAIAATISDTAVDVFVYDTSKDSDGGAWRHRTQNTSWYNETLNTSTRGSRKEFPAVAVIVAEAGTVTIYDGDDPDLPMWMVFNIGGANSTQCIIGRSVGQTCSSLSAINGIVSVGLTYSSDVTGGVRVIGFLEDAAYFHYYVDFVTTGKFNGPLSERNATLGFSGGASAAATIVDRDVKDVAMTVLPNAPIDPATGLPVPTIAVMTSGGISVIRDDGSVLSQSTSSYQGVRLSFDDVGNLYWSRGADGTAKYSTDPTESLSVFGLGVYTNSKGNAGAGSPKTADGIISYGTNNGFSQIKADLATANSSMVAYTTTDYTSGWMNGEIKGAFLASTDSTSLDGTTNLVSNGTFDSDLTGWSTSSADWNWHSSQRAYLNTTTNYQAITYDTNGGMEAGKSYIVTFDYECVSGSFRFAQVAVNDYTTVFGTGTGTATIVIGSQPTNANADRIQFRNQTASTELYIDNVSITPADPDRSVNGNALAVNETITKSAVATNAELMGYYGFSTSNYLEQPYNSDLDFGTDEFAIVGWLKQAANTAVETILERDSATTAQRFTLAVNASGFLTFTCDDDTTARTATSNVVVDNDVWTHFVALYDGAGAVKIYLNGALDDTETGSALLTLNNASAVLRVGLAVDGAEPLANADLALLRISATVPSDSQIKKIYNDEKYLFQEGAACTIDGSSDAVTALAHDSDTNLLHVGTSAGRSVFQGLRRVDSTTDAVGVAISAQNNLVVDE